ncbi:hypothetical protein DSO57_1026894 [Entomophthora muscae]|uniref:Uncharacterized protein n=1 Tax=Entomophthora muscae TaxID=34485 RepID=A0ACC2UB07_9FUNG|nr:hypothetical protein DSO57_1026894 [Entomophthora muscae]
MFHSHPPTAEQTLDNCNPGYHADSTLEVVETSYILANISKITSVACPAGRFCLLKARYSSGEWKVDGHHFPYTGTGQNGKLATIIASLIKNKIYHLTIQGPVSGEVAFTNIRYQTNYTFQRRGTGRSITSRRLSSTKTCRVALENGAPDGLLSFIQSTPS